MSLVVHCVCGTQKTIKVVKKGKDYTQWQCRKCAIAAKWADPTYRQNRAKQRRPRNPEQRQTASTTSKRLWADPTYRQKVSDGVKSRWRNAAYRQLISNLSKQNWNDAAYRNRVIAKLEGRKLTDDHRESISQAVAALWRDPTYRSKLTDILQSETNRQRSAAVSKRLWLDQEFAARYGSQHYRDACSSRSLKLWESQEYRDRIAATKSSESYKKRMAAVYASQEYREKIAQSTAHQPRVSSLQTMLYSILDDCGVPYYREWPDRSADPQCTIGPWTFDCVIPRQGLSTLLVECNGDWVHSQPRKVAADRAKASYAANFKEYELKYLWEHEFANYEKVIQTVKYWLGIDKANLVDYGLNQLSIKPCPAADYKLLLSKYHYLPNAGRGGLAFGAYLDDLLVAVAIFSPLPRQNIIIDGQPPDDVRELSRLCVHPNYRSHNLISWFLARCMKLLPVRFAAVVAYSDTTFNHYGSVYKACNFILDGETVPDYWYSSAGGWMMHKKTLYNKAVSLGLTEHEYADRFGYFKVVGGAKKRYVYRLKRV